MKSLPATSLKSSLNQFIIPIKTKCKDIYEESVYDKLLTLQSNEETTLNIYSRIKTHYKYETYLNLLPYNKIITKFRLSNHYVKPKFINVHAHSEINVYAHSVNPMWVTNCMFYLNVSMAP